MIPDSLPATSGLRAVDALAIACPYCRAPAGQRCGVRGFGTWWARPAQRAHKRRADTARTLASHADPVLDKWFPKLGPCGICATPGLDQRHRVIDAIAGAVMAGEGEPDLAADYDVPVAAVFAVAEWARQWQPGEGQQR